MKQILLCKKTKTKNGKSQWRIQGGGGRPPPIDRMQLETGENLARKCTIFA